MLALGTIETVGLAAAIEAADVACKTADIHLVGYELTKGGGLVVVKVEGQVASVQTAIQAAQAAASLVGRVAGISVIPRPSEQLELMVRNPKTVGWATRAPASKAAAPAVAQSAPASKPAAKKPSPQSEAVAAEAPKTATKEPVDNEQPKVPGEQEKTPAAEKQPAPSKGDAPAKVAKNTETESEPKTTAAKPATGGARPKQIKK